MAKIVISGINEVRKKITKGRILWRLRFAVNEKKGEANSKYAYRLLRKNIMSFRLVPGEAADEMDISDQLGMSRTPVREAMILLKNEKPGRYFTAEGKQGQLY